MNDRKFPKLFPDVKSIGELEPEELAEALRELGDEDRAVQVEDTVAEHGAKEFFGIFGRRPYEYANQTIGFVEPLKPDSPQQLAIKAMGAIEPDETLKNSRIDIRLDKLRIFDYPGWGKHNVLVTFKADHQAEGQNNSEQLVFNQGFDVGEDEIAGVVGYPIFNGLQVGPRGAAFQLATTNVRNHSDEGFLNFLNSSSVTSGLSLLTSAQPAIKPLTDIGKGVVESILKRNRNKKVQELYLGLDFGDAALGARLRCGNYIVVQVERPQDLNWDNWVYDRTLAAIVLKDDPSESLPYNYFAFRVSKSPT